MANRARIFSTLLCISALSTLAPATAGAQEGGRTHALPSFELERLQLDPGALGSLVVGTGRTLGAGVFRASFQGHYEQIPLKFSDEWAPTNGDGLVNGRFTLHVTAAYGVLDWLQVGVQVPFIAAQKGARHLDLQPPEGGGLGTPWVSVRAALLRMEAGAPLNLALDVTAGIPVGSQELLARDEFAATPRLMAGFMTPDFQVGGEVGLHLRKRHDFTDMAKWPDSVVGNEVRLGLALTSRGGDVTRGEVSVLGAVPLEGGRASAEVLIGIRRHLGASGMDLFILGGPGLGTAFDEPTFRVLGGVTFGTVKVD